MAKDFNGGISSGSLELLIQQLNNSSRAVSSLMAAIALEEHDASLVDPAKVKGTPACAAIKRARQAADAQIGSSETTGLIATLKSSTTELVKAQRLVEELQALYASVMEEPTASVGC